MKILFVSDVSIQDVIGGAERVLHEQARRLADNGHTVQVMTRQTPFHEKEVEVVDGVHEWRYPFNPESAASLYQTIRRGEVLFHKLWDRYHYDCINFHQPFTALSVIFSKTTNQARKIYTCHSLSFEEYASRNPQPLESSRRLKRFLNLSIRRFLEKAVLDKCERIVVLSQYTNEKLKRIHHIQPRKIAIIPGGVDLKRFHPIKNRGFIKRQFGLPDKGVLLFTVRNLVPRMGLETLIRAMHQALKKTRDLYLVIGGEGTLEKPLKSLCRQLGLQEHIRFSGFIPEDQLPAYYGAADLFVLPTRELEGFGLVTLEAMACATPVIGTPIGGTREILEAFDPTCLFNGVSADGISEVIVDKVKQLRSDSERWREMTIRCRRFVEDRYSWDKNIKMTERILSGG
ncbi:MAG: glycosyltransferase family 4 protein [Pseudomonadota bacterium]